MNRRGVAWKKNKELRETWERRHRRKTENYLNHEITWNYFELLSFFLECQETDIRIEMGNLLRFVFSIKVFVLLSYKKLEMTALKFDRKWFFVSDSDPIHSPMSQLATINSKQQETSNFIKILHKIFNSISSLQHAPLLLLLLYFGA